jgi:cation:H+ antiporter
MLTPLGWVAVQFAACAVLILFSGVRLSRYGDVIAEKTGLGGTWIGVVMMAGVTSLPELITGASSILVFDVPDIAVGNAVGACAVNLVILALLDARHPEPLSARIHQGHVLSAGFGSLQFGLAGLAMIAADRAPMLGWIALHSVLFIALYLVAVRAIFVFERSRLAQLAEELTGDIRYRDFTLKGAVTAYAANAALLVAAAAYLPGVGEQLARETALDESFVGSLFVALTTTLPEVVVSVAAVRMGALDMAAANLFGSNLFNIAVLGVDDLLYTRGSVLAAVAPVHLVMLVAAVMMTSAAIIGLTYRAARKRYRLSWDALAIVTIYVVAIVTLGRG